MMISLFYGTSPHDFAGLYHILLRPSFWGHLLLGVLPQKLSDCHCAQPNGCFCSALLDDQSAEVP